MRRRQIYAAIAAQEASARGPDVRQTNIARQMLDDFAANTAPNTELIAKLKKRPGRKPKAKAE